MPDAPHRDIEQPHIIPIRTVGFWDYMLRQRYLLREEYSYEWIAEGRRWKITVPKGTITDGASIPRLLWTLTGITPDGLHRPAALVHDLLYQHRGALPSGLCQRQDTPISEWTTITVPWSRQEADALFARILRELDVGKFRRRLMYLGVRLGGWRAWETN